MSYPGSVAILALFLGKLLQGFLHGQSRHCYSRAKCGTFDFLLNTRFIRISGDSNRFSIQTDLADIENKAGYTANLVACGWVGAVLEKVTSAFGQEK